MKKKFLSVVPKFLSFALVFCAAHVPAHAAGEGRAATFPELKDSVYIYGDKITKKDLAGKVVLWEYWGINCGPCKASFPHLQSLYRKYGAHERFVIVGSHMQGPSPQIVPFLKDNGITFPIYQWVRIPEAPGAGFLPYGVLIGADGKIIKADHPNQLYPLIDDAMKKFDRGQPIFPGKDFPRYKSVAGTLVYGGKNLEGKIEPLRAKTDDEAKALCAAFDRWTKNEFRILKKLLKANPIDGLAFYEELKEALPVASKEFAGKIAELKKDKNIAKLADIRKKVEIFEQRKAQGKKISGSSVNSMKRSLDSCLKSADDNVKNAARNLSSRLDALTKK